MTTSAPVSVAVPTTTVDVGHGRNQAVLRVGVKANGQPQSWSVAGQLLEKQDKTIRLLLAAFGPDLSEAYVVDDQADLVLFFQSPEAADAHLIQAGELIKEILAD